MEKLTFLIFCIVVVSCVPVAQTTDSGAPSDNLRLEDFIYEENIKTVQLTPPGFTPGERLSPAVSALAQQQPLVLRFDDLAEEVDDYYARIIHCNADWTKSLLNELEYIADFNEYAIDDYEYSFNTKTPYVSYRLQLPRVKLPGNYVVAVYRYPNEDDLVLTRRFMIVDNRIAIDVEAAVSSGIAERRTNQQIKFTINYGDFNVSNPYQDIKVVLRQNQRWETAITDLKPTLIREDVSQLVYDHFNLENNFQGGNEFRYFDLRSVSFLGQNVDNVVEQNNQLHAFLMRDRPRAGQAYGIHNDLNGKYLIENIETGETLLEAEYVNVHFFLQTPNPYPHDIYIYGALTNWQFTPENKMTYDAEIEGYRGSLLLKQGWYNYLYYAPQAGDPYLVEGSHYETENEYDLIIYHRPIGSRADYIIGYESLTYKY